MFRLSQSRFQLASDVDSAERVTNQSSGDCHFTLDAMMIGVTPGSMNWAIWVKSSLVSTMQPSLVRGGRL